MFDYDNRISRLKARRQGKTHHAATSSFSESLPDSIFESYVHRSSNKASNYALLSMQPVSDAYTANSYREAERIQNQLTKAFSNEDIAAEYKYQGSVPLNIHIKGASDIDFLALSSTWITVQRPPVNPNIYPEPSYYGSIVDTILQIRNVAHSRLKTSFPEATVTPGAKSIKVSGGSLGRDVDIVPAAWHDSHTYQTSGDYHLREVRILDTSTNSTLINKPFLHIHRVNQKDASSHGGAKKAIRFLKNIKSDADEQIALTSYDLASIAYHMDLQSLTRHRLGEELLVAEIYKYITYLANNKQHATSLVVPDETRQVFDTEAKFNSLLILQKEVLQVSFDFAQNLSPHRTITASSIYETISNHTRW